MRTGHDQLAKQILVTALKPLGRVESEREVAPSPLSVDVYFEASGAPPPAELGLLGRLAETSCLIEPFSSAPSPEDVRGCLQKLFAIDQELRRAGDPVVALPRLWIVSAGVPRTVLREAALRPAEGFPPGVWRSAEMFRLWVIVVPALPREPSTLLLRLLGRGRTRFDALADLRGLPPDDVVHRRIGRVMARLRPDGVDLEDKELEMFSVMSDEEFEGVEAAAREEGAREEQRRLLRGMFEVRMARPLSDAEQVALGDRLRDLGVDRVAAVVLEEPADKLAAWLISSPTG
jgi:hypothetical protein